MALFVKQNEHRSELQDRVAAELSERIKNRPPQTGEPDASEIIEESQEATGRSLFWVGVVTMLVIALVVFVLVVFEG